ncbi:MAG TPA: YraN family protein [Gaiellales bacterium]|jgi:putative endonuclease|nr:YraN family protein [Gaiellales bacterium]
MPSSISDSDYGRLAEAAAAWWLRLRGYRIVARNVRVAGREVDVLAQRGCTLVVCEVKARRSPRRGEPAEAVDAAKRRRLREAGEILLASQPGAERVRFDVIAVSGLRIRHIRAAF